MEYICRKSSRGEFICRAARLLDRSEKHLSHHVSNLWIFKPQRYDMNIPLQTNHWLCPVLRVVLPTHEEKWNPFFSQMLILQRDTTSKCGHRINAISADYLPTFACGPRWLLRGVVTGGSVLRTWITPVELVNVSCERWARESEKWQAVPAWSKLRVGFAPTTHTFLPPYPPGRVNLVSVKRREKSQSRGLHAFALLFHPCARH